MLLASSATGKGAYKIDSDNQLSLALAGALNLGSRAWSLELLVHRTAWRTGRRVSLGRRWLLPEPGRTSHRRRTLAHGSHTGWIAHGGSGVDRGRTANHLSRRSAVRLLSERTGSTERSLSRREVCSVARRTVTGARMIHRKARRRRRWGD